MKIAIFGNGKMGKKISQPEFTNKKYVTSFLFKLKNKKAALYSALGGFAINGVNLTKLIFSFLQLTQ